MKINLETDYAIRIVQCLAACTERLYASLIAERTGVPMRFSLKILRKLVDAGVVRSFKGAHGGYITARDPDQVTLRQVIEAIDGPIAIGPCQCDSYICGHPEEKECYFHTVFRDITKELSDRLDQVTFASESQDQLLCSQKDTPVHTPTSLPDCV